MTSSFFRRVDWRLALGLPPKRRFTAAELHAAQTSDINPTVVVSAALNITLPLAISSLFMLRERVWPLAALMLVFALMLALAGRHIWRDPSSRTSYAFYWALPIATGLSLGLIGKLQEPPRLALLLSITVVFLGTLAMWFGMVYRHNLIETRLRELQERERAINMARRLAAAQIEPHFLFNSLASLQHWVDRGDKRAAPFLRSLTGYLRATLPMFSQALQPLSAELQAVSRYLEVMQGRLGDRLHWRVDVSDALLATPLPPGTLLTLVENAIEHGIEPLLRPGELVVSARRLSTSPAGSTSHQGPAVPHDGNPKPRDEVGPGRIELCVSDNGPGLANPAADGQGLANVRERLQLAFGPNAGLSLSSPPAGGCEARLIWTLP